MEKGGINLYLREMWLVKNRMNAIRSIKTHKQTTLFPVTNIEFMTLQIRKIIEHIAMGNLIANKELYEEYSAKFSSNWNAKYIFRDLERLNPRFYPEPVKTDNSEKIRKWVPVNDDYLSKEEAVKIYDKCSALMHTANPYGSTIDLKYYEKMIPIWYKKIVNLLSQHLIHMVDGEHLYCIVMNREENPRGYEFILCDSSEVELQEELDMSPLQ